MDKTIRQGLMVGGIAGAAAIGATLACGLVERGSAWEPVNSIAHMVLGDDLEIEKGFDPKETLIGLAGHASAALSWGVLYAQLFGKARGPEALALAAAYTAGVWAVDYRVVPKRFTPGFEKVLSPRSIAIIYAALGAGFAAAPLVAGTGKRG